MSLEFDDLEQPLCERCMNHWRVDKPRMANPRRYFTTFHERGHLWTSWVAC